MAAESEGRSRPTSALHVQPSFGATLLVVAAIGTSVVVGNIFVAAQHTMAWAFATVVVAWLLSAIIDLLSTRMRRSLALLLTMFGLVLFVVGTWIGVVASLRVEVDHIRTSLPRAAEQLESRSDAVARFRLADRIDAFVAGLDQRFSTGATVSKTAGTAPVYFVTGVLLLFFLGYGPRFLAGALKQIRDEDRKRTVARVVARASTRARRYVLITLAQMMIVAAIGAGVFSLLDLPAPFVLGMLLGSLSAIPAVGVVLGGIPAFLLAAADPRAVTFLSVAALALGLQLIEIMVVRRRVDPATVRVGPAPVLVAAIIGFSLYGYGGAAYAAVVIVFVLALLDSWAAVAPRH